MEDGSAAHNDRVGYFKNGLSGDDIWATIKKLHEDMEAIGPLGEVKHSMFVPDDGLYLIDTHNLTGVNWLPRHPIYADRPRWLLVGQPKTLAKLQFREGIQRLPKELIQMFHEKRKANADNGEGASEAGNR